MCPTVLDETKVLYSFGVGTDVSFDLELIQCFGVQVHAFDPSPIAGKWIAGRHVPKQFHFHPIGLADTDGIRVFNPPEQAGWCSYSMLPESVRPVPQDAEEPIRCPVATLPTIMRKLGHNRIDVLKLDIEGAEYEVVEALVHSGIEVGQLLVEFHHRYVGLSRTATAIRKLNQIGFGIFHISETGNEYSFLAHG